MDSRITEFIGDLKAQLSGLPEEEIFEALNYYEEYLAEAVDSEKDFDEVIQELGSSDKIAAIIRTEVNLKRVEQNPSFRNLLNMFRSAFKGLSTPFAAFGLSVLSVIPFSMVVIFFAAAFACALAAALGAATFVYEAVMLSGNFILEKVGTVGAALMWAGLLLLLAVLLYRGGKVFIRLSVKFIRLIMGKSMKTISESLESNMRGPSKSKHLILALAIAFTVGIITFSASGLPWSYFVIFNSMKPEAKITKVISEYDPGSINKISVVTAHSAVKLEQSSSDKLIISYEKADWLDYEIGSSGSMLSFFEKSSGKLPLFQLVSLHESRTELLIILPRGFHPETLTVESTGGHVFISGLAENIMVKTLNGSVNLSSEGTDQDYNVRAKTKNGSIKVGDFETGQKVYEGIEYYNSIKSGKTIELTSTNGNINIE